MLATYGKYGSYLRLLDYFLGNRDKSYKRVRYKGGELVSSASSPF